MKLFSVCSFFLAVSFAWQSWYLSVRVAVRNPSFGAQSLGTKQLPENLKLISKSMVFKKLNFFSIL